MKLPENGYVKQVIGNTDLSLQADAGESLLVLGAYVHNPSGNYVTLRTERVTVGYFRVGGNQGNHLYFPQDADEWPNLLDLLRDAEIFSGYPVAEGETFEITGAAQAGAVQAVSYVRGEAGDYTPDQANGSRAREYLYVNYGRVSGGAGDGENAYDTSQSPAEFPAFPFGDTATENRLTVLHGLCLSDIGITTATQANQQETRYLKLIKERETLYDEDRNGLLCLGEAATGSDVVQVAVGQSLVGNRTLSDLTPPLLLDAPLEFQGGEELNVSITTSVEAGSANFSAGDAEVGIVTQVIPEGGRR